MRLLQKYASVLWAFLATAAIFAILWLRDYPKPMVDDLYYTGAALHMAEGGDFSNPLIQRQAYPSHYFFVYPPLHSYALFGWLKVFGISVLSMTGFQMFLYLVIAASAMAILTKHNAPKFMAWMVPLAVCTALLPTGLRSETLSVGLTMAGLALIECDICGYAGSFIAFLLMCLGASAAPRLAFFSAALVLFEAYKIFKQPGKGKVVIISGAAALVCACLVFLVQIHFLIGEFWHTFHTHAHLVDRRKVDMLIGYLNENRYVNGAQAPLIWALAALMIFAWPKQWSALPRLTLAIGAGFILEAIAGGLGAGVLWYIGFALILFSSAVIESLPGLKPRLTGAIVFLFLLANVKFMLTEISRIRGRITMERGPLEQTALELRSTPEHPVLIDRDTARYVYNYRIPEGFLDIEFAAPFPKSHVHYKPLPEDTYVIGPGNVRVLKETTHLEQPLIERGYFGLANRHFYTQPCMVYIIRAADLHFTGDLPR